MLAGLTTTAQVAGKPPETRFARPLRAGTTEKPPSPFRVFEKNSTTARTKTVQKLPLVYRYEKWDEASHQYRLQFKENLVFSTTDVFKIYATEPDDTTEIQETTMAADFKNEDILDLLIPEYPNISFLRPVRGTFQGSFLESALKLKQDNSFILIESLKGRRTLPYANVYSEGFSLFTCQNNNQAGFDIETASTGTLVNDIWTTESLTTTHDCQSHDVREQQREIHKFDLRGNHIEYIAYNRENGNDVLSDHQTFAYNDMDRVTTQISVTGNKKYESTYDAYGNDLTDQFSWNGTDWIQTYQTTGEITTNAGITIDTHVTWQMTGNGWTNRWRDIYHYNDQPRGLRVEHDTFDAGTQDWLIDYLFTFTYDGDLLITQTAYFRSSAGSKTTYRYNQNREVIHAETWSCPNAGSCLQDIYTPVSIADLVLGDTLDYAVSQNFKFGSWEKYDSAANVYDRDGSLITMSYQLLIPTGAAINERHQYIYTKEDAVTAITEDRPSEVTIYPNPVGNTLYIKTGLSNYTVDIYDACGRHAGRYINTPALDFSRQPPGIYLLSIESHGKRYRKKIIK